MRAQSMLANANAGEGRRRARQVAAVLVDVRGLQQAFERGREIGEIEMAARERMPGLSVELSVAAARGVLTGFVRNREGPLRVGSVARVCDVNAPTSACADRRLSRRIRALLNGRVAPYDRRASCRCYAESEGPPRAFRGNIAGLKSPVGCLQEI